MTQPQEPESFTQTPNTFFDKLLEEIDTLSELKVTLALIRKICGWVVFKDGVLVRKEGDEVSFSQFVEMTGLSRPMVKQGIDAALARGSITRIAKGLSFYYQLNLSNYKGQGYESKRDAQLASARDKRFSSNTGLVAKPLSGVEAKPETGLVAKHTKETELNKDLNKLTTPSGVAAPTEFEVIQVFAKENSTEKASQPGPATDKDRVQPGTGDSSLHIPAPLQPDLTQEVKGFEAGDRGRDMAHGKKARDKPKVKGKEPDSRRNHPNVEFYKLHMHYSAKEDQLELLTSEEFDFTRLLDAFKFWKDSGYYRGNIRGVIDVYHDEGKLYGYRSQRRQNLAGNGITTPRAFNPIPKPIKPRGSRPDGGFTTAEFAEDY